MKLSIAEIMVILDTLGGSLCLKDRIDTPLFGYSHEIRDAVRKKLEQWANEASVELLDEVGDDDKRGI